MKRRAVIWLGVPLIAVAIVGGLSLLRNRPEEAPQRPQLQIQETVLDNGLKVLDYEEDTEPIVSVHLWYLAGMRHEPEGKGDIAHLLEHLVFEEPMRLFDQAGGAANAFTGSDMTGYFVTLPAENLELALRLNAERMQELIINQEKVDTEREVVKEEYRLRFENDPVSKAFETFRAIVLKGTPYRWLPGKDIDKITVEDLQNFYRAYYAPNNAVLIVAGDVKAEAVFELAQRYFGPIPKREVPATEAISPPAGEAMREETLELPVRLPAILVGYRLPGAAHADIPALELLGYILFEGESARLYKRLVREQRIAVSAGGGPLLFKDAGLLLFYAFFDPDEQEAEKVKEALLSEIERLTIESVLDRELQRAKNQLSSQYTFDLDSLSSVASGLGGAEVLEGDWREFLKFEYDGLTAADLKRVAQTHFKRENLVVVTIKPQEGGGR